MISSKANHTNSIQIEPTSIIYVACPPNFATGGTELLHQLVYHLNKLDFKAKIFYYNSKSKASDSLIHPFFKNYNCEFVTEVNDVYENVLIVPEIKTDVLFHFKNIRKAIWWLSVDSFYKKTNKRRLAEAIGLSRSFNLKKHQQGNVTLHLVQSFYAKAHLNKHGITNIAFLSDYLNSEFINAKKNSKKEDIILYNPKKGWEFTSKIIEQSKELNWKALENMAPQEIGQLMRKSKVYIDFGNHPGKDRFPREAAISGCCVITGLRGSASFNDDVPIPSEFKIEDKFENIGLIIQTIKRCLAFYNAEQPKFDFYRNKTMHEEEQFQKDILEIFKRT